MFFAKNGKVQYDIKANDNIRSLKKKIMKKYQLSKDIVLTDKYLKPFLEYMKVSEINSTIYIGFKFNGVIIQTSIKRTKIHYNGWNIKSLNKYMNLLIGGTKMKMIVLIDGNSISNSQQPIENNNDIDYLHATVTNEEADEFPDYMIAPFDDLEIKGIMIKGRGFTKAVYAWNKVIIKYALLI
jgi:hypothetical protein